MRILFLTQVLPYPLDAGPKVRAYYTLRHLAQQHEITLLSFTRRSDSAQSIEHLRGFCQQVHTVPIERSRLADGYHLVRSLLTNTPFLITRDWVPEMAKRVRELALGNPPFDVVHADQLWMAPYALLLQETRAQEHPPKTVLDQHNAVFQIPYRLTEQEANPAKRALLSLEGRKLARYERDVCKQFDHVVWVTEEDRVALEHLSSTDERTNDSIIPICTDPDGEQVILRRPEAHRVTFLGGLHWPPNGEGIRWFAREVWPQVLEQVPGATLTIIGKDPPAELVALSDTLSTNGNQGSAIEITGYVPDPLPYLVETGAFIVPLHAGGGMRVKILDAWRWGLPVISTSIGAEGIHVRDGENMLVADSSVAFAAAVVRVLQEQALSTRLAAGGRATLESHYNYHTLYKAWDKVYAELLCSSKATSRA